MTDYFVTPNDFDGDVTEKKFNNELNQCQL